MRIYIAGGWFSEEQLKHLVEVEDLVKQTNHKHFAPRTMNLGQDGCDWSFIFDENIKHLEDCDMVVASTVGKDMGTIWECGYGYAKGKTIVYYTPGIARPNLMLGMSGIVCKTYEELKNLIVNGIYPNELKDFE